MHTVADYDPVSATEAQRRTWRIPNHAPASAASLYFQMLYTTASTIHTPDALHESLAEMDRYARLASDWDYEGAKAADVRAITLAKSFVRQVYQYALKDHLAWKPPNVSPISNGGIELEWEAGADWITLSFLPGNQSEVEAVIKQDEDPPRREIVPLWQAKEQVLWALRQS